MATIVKSAENETMRITSRNSGRIKQKEAQRDSAKSGLSDCSEAAKISLSRLRHDETQIVKNEEKTKKKGK
jgi:hypothetical protein